jgi:hypothetical protein
MKKKYLAVILLLIICSIAKVNALTIDNCEVLASYKLYSSLDEENYICKGKEYGSSIDAIYYSGSGSKIILNNFNAYYFTSWEENDVTIDIIGTNNISMLQLSNSKFSVIGSGSLKFKQNSFVKKVINGEAVYQYVYKDKTVQNSDKKIYEGKIKEFEENYELLKEMNKLPEEYNLEDYELVQVVDYTKMIPVVVTDEWIKQHISTELVIETVDRFGLVKYEKPKTEKAPETTGKKQNNNQLETDNVILISDKKVNTKYKLKEENLKDHEVATKVDDRIEKDLVSLYDVTVYNGKKQVPMKNGKYTIKIKLDGNIDNYNNYQIIYVNDDGEIEEYIDGRIEGEYIVFNTSHLSQYGVIASPIVQEELATKEEIKEINPVISNIFKISILVVFTLGAACLVGVLYYKCYTLSNKNIKKRA